MALIQVVNENSTCWITINLYDRTGVLAAPNSLSYRVDCLTTGLNMIADTNVSVPAGSNEIMIPNSANIINNQQNALEQRVMTITAVYGANDQLQTEYLFNVKNLSFRD